MSSRSASRLLIRGSLYGAERPGAGWTVSRWLQCFTIRAPEPAVPPTYCIHADSRWFHPETVGAAIGFIAQRARESSGGEAGAPHDLAKKRHQRHKRHGRRPPGSVEEMTSLRGLRGFPLASSRSHPPRHTPEPQKRKRDPTGCREDIFGERAARGMGAWNRSPHVGGAPCP